MVLEKTTFDTIKHYRKAYLASTPQFQELYIELMVGNADYYLLQQNNQAIGYLIKNNEGVLIEFYVFDNFIPVCHEIFTQAIEELSISDIYCKSFDSLLLSNCLLSSFSYSVLGILYRDYVTPMILKDLGVKMEKASLQTVELLLHQDVSIKELFETEQQLTDFIVNEHVFTFTKNEELVGCGMVIRTNPDWGYCDLGVWVTPSKRGNAFGAQIILNLREFALANNMKPSCGCAIDNMASQRTIEKSGFVSKFKLINFNTKQIIYE